MSAIADSFVTPQLSRHGRALGPVTASRLRRSALIYAVLCTLGILPAVFGASPGLQAAGLGLWFPGAGFLASGGWSLLLLPLTAVLFGASLIAWFGAGMVVAPVFVWGGAALLAGALAGDGIWRPAAIVVPALTALGGVVLHRRGEQRRAKARAQGEDRAAYLSSASSTAFARAVSESIGRRELSAEDLRSVRYLLDRALQPIGELRGFDRIDQFQTSALRYQINHAGNALAEIQCAYTPSFHGYLSEAQRNLIDQYLQRQIWSYWLYETAWGHLNFTNFDPAARDNIMLTGWFGLHVGLYMSTTGDRRYAEPGSLSFRLNERTVYRHDAHTLARSVAENFASSAFCLYPCEPNWVYPICNHYGMTSLLLHDRLFGTSYVPDNLGNWLANLDREFTDESGSIVGLRSSLTGLRFPFPGGELGFAAFENCWAPERAERLWTIAHHDLARAITKDADGEPRLSIPGRGFDFGNYRLGLAYTWAAIAASAQEFGDEEIARAAQRSLEQDGAPTHDRGVTHYQAMSNLGNLAAVTGRLRRRGDFRRVAAEGPPASVLQGPILADAKYPDVLVGHAFSHGDDLELVLHPGASRGAQRIRIERLRPGQAYELRGAEKQRFSADASGAAELSVALHERTALEIVPVA
jgi:hypothetical protein